MSKNIIATKSALDLQQIIDGTNILSDDEKHHIAIHAIEEELDHRYKKSGREHETALLASNASAEYYKDKLAEADEEVAGASEAIKELKANLNIARNGLLEIDDAMTLDGAKEIAATAHANSE